MKTGGEVIKFGPESSFSELYTQRLMRLHDDGPEAYLREIATLAEIIAEERTE